MEIKASTESTKEQNILCKVDKTKLIRYVQEFQLSQRFPSTVRQADLMTWQNKNMTNTISIIPKNFKLLPRANCVIPGKKLRIMSLKGRDLGVFNLEVCNDHNNPSKEMTLKITKSNSFKPVNKPVTISLSSVPHMSKILPQTFKQKTVKIPKNKLVNVTFSGKYIYNGEQTLLKPQGITMPIKETVICDRNSDINKKIQACDNDIDVEKNFISDERTSKLCVDNVANINCRKHTEREYGSVILTKDNKYSTEDVIPLPRTDGIVRNNEISLACESYKKIAESPFPIVRCKKLDTDSDDVKIHFKTHKESYPAFTKSVENEKTSFVLDNISNFTQKYNQVDRNLNEKESKSAKSHEISINRNSFSQIKNSEVANIIHEDEQINDTRIQKDIMTIIPNHGNLLFHKNTISTLKQDTVASSESNKNMTNMTTLHKTTHYTNRIIRNNSQTRNISVDEGSGNNSPLLVSNAQCIPSELEEVVTDVMNINAQSNEQDVHPSKNPCEKNLSDRWDIIKMAVSSVTDDELRAQALKALADCGIGIERRVPVHPPDKFKSVHDTQVQTTIFGLLDPKSFALINKDLDSIQRIPQITLHHKPYAQNALLENNLHPYDSLFKISDTDSIDNLDIESLFAEMFKEDPNAQKVKETLSTRNRGYKKILDQLEKDFEFIKKYDQNGMLNIHKAIISNSIFDVRRHLMMLRQCKENVDILTEDGVTSLELAVKYDVCSEIVKLLLEAGARPVISELAHESALIIAGKRSSTLLPMLVKYISNSRLLDQIDEEGFTTLHYCCIHGNLEGVNALISSGANINFRDMKSGRTPVFHAVENNHTKVVQTLIHAGAVPTTANFAGQTPIPIISEAKNIFQNLI